MLSFDGVELEFEEQALYTIAEKAIDRKTGARGLRSIIEDVMLDIMFEVPSDESIKKVVITKEAVRGENVPQLIRTEEKEKHES